MSRYLNNTSDALLLFNKCRRDVEWAEPALYQMIELFLNPENSIAGGQILENIQDIQTEGLEVNLLVDMDDGSETSDVLAVLSADKLLAVMYYSCLGN